MISPGTTATLIWNAVTALTDQYEVQVLDAGGSLAFQGTTTATTIRTTSLSMGATYFWRVRAINTTCGTDIGAWSTSGYFQFDNIPEVIRITLKNSSGGIVAWDSGNRNHICKSGFYADPNPREVTFEVTIEDGDGWADIQSGRLRWNGWVYNLPMMEGAGMSVRRFRPMRYNPSCLITSWEIPT